NIVSLSTMTEKEVLNTAASIESLSQRPLAAAVLRKAQSSSIILAEVENFQYMTGTGANAEVDRQLYYIGSPHLFTA
ncbi:cation-transporting P-type ATPase, partial [Planococcus sp. SIMBA_160]